ncbi:hypothetical protein XI01_05080 [Bradyrhizobium sp. CCBAU 21360]|nr:hypothetical protein [Bradyrhizobium sp. CCBAU 21360]MDA9446095.1 hypothetical protein [Bradyrhizobium sp. CCBAU 21360]
MDFTTTLGNRVKAAQEPGGGVPLAFSFEQTLLDAEWFSVVKGAPNKENAMKFIAHNLRPEVQARLGCFRNSSRVQEGRTEVVGCVSKVAAGFD